MNPLLPPVLNTPAFAYKWREYEGYRREMRFRKLLPSTVQRRWDMLAKYGPDVAIAAIDQAMDQQWQGIFPEKIQPRQQQRRMSFA